MPLVRDASGRLVHRALGDPVADKTGSPTVGSAPVDAQYVTLIADATLTQERTLAVGTGLSLTDAGAGSTVTIAPDLDLAALEALGSTGIAVRTAANTWAQRTLQAPAAGLTITNPAGVAGDPTFAFANDLSALEGLGATGIAVRTAADTWAQRTVVDAGSGRVGVTNPGGVAGNITLDVNGAALTKVDDTNVTLTLGGSASTALVNAASLTLGWTGTLAAGRLNSNVVQGVTNDTNVTGSIAAQNLTLGWTGTLAAGRLNSNVVQSVVNDTNVTGSIAAQALTLGWTGTLDVTRGGTGRATSTTAYGLLAAGTTATGAHQTLAAGATTEILVGGGASALPVWTTATGSGAPVRATSPTIATPTITTHATCPLVYGGPSTSDNLDLYANDEAIAQANTGRVRLYERAKLHVGYAGGTASTAESLLEFDNTYTAASATTVYGINLTPTITVNNLFGHLLQGVRYAPTTSHTTGTSISNTIVFQNAASLRATGTGTNPPGCISFDDFVTFYSSTSSATTALTEAFSFRSRPSVTSTGAGSVLTITDYFQHDAAFTMTTDNATGAATVTTRRGYYFRDASLSGAGTETLTTQVGFDVAALSAAGTNIGIRNASTTVFTEAVSTISAASSTIASSATLIRLNNTSGGAVVLSSTPHIANGQDGQLLIIYNGSANTVTISDQGTVASSGLRLVTSTIALGTRDSVMLVYSSTIGDWIQIGAGTPTTASGGSNVI